MAWMGVQAFWMAARRKGDAAGRQCLSAGFGLAKSMRLGGRGSWLLLLALLFAGCVSAEGGKPGPVAAGPARDGGFDVVVENVTVETVEAGVTVPALLGYVDGGEVTKLVVMAHGYGHTVEISWVQYVGSVPRPDTAVIATDYRDNLMFPILKGAEDVINATLLALERFPTVETVYLLGVSMGGAVSGTAITESVGLRAPGKSLYDFWIDAEGVSMPAETWAEATAIGHPAAAQIEHDAGATPVEDPDAYVRRSPALRADEMKAAGLQAAVVIHAYNDGLVPFNQGREMATALYAATIPTQFFHVTRDGDGQTSGTTGTGAISGALGQPDPNEDTTNLSGHASEADPGHPVMRTALEQLDLMLDGTYAVSFGEWVVDDQI